MLSSLLKIPPPPTSTLLPYTTLFRSAADHRSQRARAGAHHRGPPGHEPDRLGQDPSRGPASSPARSDRRSARWCAPVGEDRKSTRLNSSHMSSSYAVFCLKKKKKK